jgi:hypothetical protein
MQRADLQLITLLDDRMNAGDGAAAGSVQWTVPAPPAEPVLYYVVPINNKC